jgi:hypothetical protein
MIIEAVAAILMQSAAGGDFRPGREADPYARCTCPAIDKDNLVSFTGIASDAQMTLGDDGRSAEARQATIFRVQKGMGADVPELVKVWHVTNPAKCGVKFDYGKRYTIVAEKNSNGELETSYCVMPKPAN